VLIDTKMTIHRAGPVYSLVLLKICLRLQYQYDKIRNLAYRIGIEDAGLLGLLP